MKRKKKDPHSGTMLQWGLPYVRAQQKEYRRKRKEALHVEYGLITKPTPYVEYTPPPPLVPLMDGKPVHAFRRLIEKMRSLEIS